jgi:hypothetical protein
MHERNVAPVADGMQRGCGLRQMFANDADIANLPIGQAELEMGQADRARIMCQLRLFERPCVKRDRA